MLSWETSLTQHISASHSARLQASSVRELSCVPTASDAGSSTPGVRRVHGVPQPLLQIVHRGCCTFADISANTVRT